MIAVLFSALMILTSFAVLGGNSGFQPQTSLIKPRSPESIVNVKAASPTTPWQMPTTTMQEPHYANTTFKLGVDCNPNNLNPFSGGTICDGIIFNEVYDKLVNQEPNGTYVPWLAQNYSVTNVGSGHSTYDIETNSVQNYSYVYTIDLRPFVQWTDWSAPNASQTYTFSNATCFYFHGVKTFHTYKSFKSTSMKKYYLQSADVVLTWRMESSLGDWPSVVSMVPDGNLSVKMYTTVETPLIISNDMCNRIVPYNIWHQHDFTSIAGLFNYTPGVKSGDGFYGWTLGWNSATGNVPGLVGSGPFMVRNNYRMPEGYIVPSQEEVLYVNPHYFVQYTKSLRQFTPKFYEIDMPFYSSLTGVVAAYDKNEIDSSEMAMQSDFIPQLTSAPHSSIYLKPGNGFSFFWLNTAVAPMNVTAFREALSYATPYNYIETVIAGGYLSHSSNIVNSHDLLYYNSSSPTYTFNMEEARAKLDSINGMQNISGSLYYLGKPVSITIQTAPGSVAPDGLEEIEATCSEWGKLGISVNVKEEAFSTEISNLDTTISAFNSTTNTRSDNQFQVAILGETTSTGEPDFQCFVNPKYGVPVDGYIGPFSSCKINGQYMSGLEVQSLLDRLSNSLINASSVNAAGDLAKRIETIMIKESPFVVLGYQTDIIAESTLYSNYSTTTQNIGFFWYWSWLSVSANTSVAKVHYDYHLKLTEQFDKSTKMYSGDTGSIIYSVTNGTKPVADANISVGVSSPYGGVVNITSDTISTNSNGQATWRFEVFSPLSKLFVGCDSPNVYNLFYEEANITAIVTVGHHKETGPGNATQTLWLINPSLDLAETFNHSVYYKGQTGSILLQVTENNTGYANAAITIDPVDLVNISYNSSELRLVTNSQGYAWFNFTVDNNVTTFYNNTMIVKAQSSTNASLSIQPTVVTVAMEKKPTSTFPLALYGTIGGVVAAVIIIGAVVAYTNMKKKSKGPGKGDTEHP